MNYDAVIIGAGSIGVPTAISLSKGKLKVLVIDSCASAGQGQNKAAIGGVRATHSDGAKIAVCLRSLEIFFRWKEDNGDDINWRKGGYLFPVYNPSDENLIKDLLKTQIKYGLNISWIDKSEVLKLVEGINPENLLGASYSPDDGNVSPLLSSNAFYRKAVSLGARFNFGENALKIKTNGGKVTGVETDKGTYSAPVVINCTGGNAADIAETVGIKLPVSPDMHEAGITEPVKRMFEPMIVDIRPGEDSKNYYFYQNSEGQIVFCITPAPALYGKNRNATSQFLPSVSKRMLDLLPRLADIKVRRTWRGLYPMTPDGFPIVCRHKEAEGLISAVGMCGQGFMLGPGLGELISRMVLFQTTGKDAEILQSFSLERDFSGTEKFK